MYGGEMSQTLPTIGNRVVMAWRRQGTNIEGPRLKTGSRQSLLECAIMWMHIDALLGVAVAQDRLMLWLKMAHYERRQGSRWLIMSVESSSEG